MPNQTIAPLGVEVVNYKVSGSVIPNALNVTATSDNLTLVPASAIQVTQPDIAGNGVIRVTGGSTTGTTNITVTVTAPDGCSTVQNFRLTVATAVPTLSEWSMIVLSLLLATAGFMAMRKRTALHQSAS